MTHHNKICGLFTWMLCIYVNIYCIIVIIFSPFSYGWAMSKYLPIDGFCWYNGDKDVDNILKVLEELNEKFDIGLALEVDVSYPKNLHDIHNNLPYLPEKIIPPGSKIPKLAANLCSKRNYVVYYIALKQALKERFVLEKVNISLFLFLILFFF